jgi:lipopolysaccharide/colanic/teichoic acid biosynthesis glycosyltransferase
MLKRILDIIFSISMLIALLPLFLIIIFLINLETLGGAFYTQIRVGKFNANFKIIKFRSMYAGAELKGYLTVGDKDVRITKVGYFLRKYKLDELPQLINILKGEMSFVGPRPEVRQFIDLLDKDQLEMLSVRPGLTDFASLKYVNESEILKESDDPERKYIEDILPEKVRLGIDYIKKSNLYLDIKLVFMTIYQIAIK